MKIIFQDHLKKQYVCDAVVGMTLMEVAIANQIPGIIAECGGSCTCATCHVYIDYPWFQKIEKASSIEEDMIDFAYAIKTTSRLSCQIVLNKDYDGLVVLIPEKQA